MAAFDYRMALARGLVPPIKEAQQGILKSAGGDNVFKSEAWWNEQYDKTIDQGITETYTERINYNPLSSGGYSNIGGTNAFGMPQAVQRPQYVTKVRQKDLTQAQLNSIVSEQKGQIAKAKREAGQEDNKTKRNRRGGGGLLSKAKPIEVKGLATAMPDLGVMSLYGSDSTLGVK